MRRRMRRRTRRRTILAGGMLLLAGGGAYAAFKMSQQDAERIEQHTGMPPADLEDNELYEAMNELGIQGQPLSQEDQAALGGSVPAAPAVAPPAPAPPAAGGASMTEELEKLADLRDRGIINDDDFKAGKNKLLGL